METQKRPFVDCRFTSKSLCVRFQNVDRLQFNTVLRRFKARFPKAQWWEDRRAWKLSMADLQEVALFAYEVFGRQSLRFQDDNISQAA